MADPVAAAERVLNEVGITRIEDLALLELIAWERGALVRSTSRTRAEARIAMAGERAIITVSTTVRDSQRRQFSVAHELRHLEMHRPQGGFALGVSEDIDDWQPQRTDVNREQEANRFAAALLLPERFFEPLCRKKSRPLTSLQSWQMHSTYRWQQLRYDTCYSAMRHALSCFQEIESFSGFVVASTLTS
jgi:Zn-dependent peptidase ImmA (M78 family)